MSNHSSRKIDTEGAYDVPDGFFAEKSVIIAKSGYGKSYTARVLIEEAKDIPIVVIDPQDAYLNLPGFEYIEASQIKSAKALGVILAQTGKRTVIRVKGLTEEEQNDLVAVILTAYKKSLRRGIQLLVIDEIHKFAPETSKTSAKNIIRSISQENRSDGLGFIAVTQRPARMDKTILSQADHLFIGRVTSRADIPAVEGYLDAEDDVEKIKTLQKGQFHIVDDGVKTVTIRKSHTQHSGNSPQHILGQDTKTYEKHIGSAVSRSKPQEGNQMENPINTVSNAVGGIIPSSNSIMSLAGMGMAISAGMATSYALGRLVSSKVSSPIPYVSTNSVVGAVSTIGMYAGYRFANKRSGKVMNFAADALKYGAAGSAAYTVGSLAFDVLRAVNVQPAWLTNTVSVLTRASPAVSEGQSELDAALVA